MATPVSVGTVVDVRALKADMAGDARRARDLRPFFAAIIAPELQALIMEQFASGGTRMRGGHKWAALAESTVRAKLRRGTYHKGTLRDTDLMYDAFTDPEHPDAVEIVNRLRYARTVKGEAERRAQFHETGTKKMPARPVLGDGVPRPVIRAWSGQLLRWIETGKLPGGGVL
jgi:hypothetical protein